MAARLPGGTRRVTLGGDKNYDTQDFVSKLRDAAVTPHVAQNQHERRSSAIDARTTRHQGYAISQRKRKRVEEIFGWIKTIAGLRKTGIGARNEWDGCSPLRRRLTIWFGCETSRRWRPNCAQRQKRAEKSGSTNRRNSH